MRRASEAGRTLADLVYEAHSLSPGSKRHEELLWKIFGVACDTYPHDSQAAIKAQKFVFVEAAGRSNLEDVAAQELLSWRENKLHGIDPIFYAGKSDRLESTKPDGAMRRHKRPVKEFKPKGSLVSGFERSLRSAVKELCHYDPRSRRNEILYRRKIVALFTNRM